MASVHVWPISARALDGMRSSGGRSGIVVVVDVVVVLVAAASLVPASPSGSVAPSDEQPATTTKSASSDRIRKPREVERGAIIESNVGDRRFHPTNATLGVRTV